MMQQRGSWPGAVGQTHHDPHTHNLPARLVNMHPQVLARPLTPRRSSLIHPARAAPLQPCSAHATAVKHAAPETSTCSV